MIASTASLIGVAIGAGLSYFSVRFQQRAAEKADVRRHAVARAEARRAEQLAALDKFLWAAQQAERVGVDRYQNGLQGDDLRHRGDQAMDHVWISEKMIMVLCSTGLHEAALSYAWGLQDTVFGSFGDGNCWDYWQPRREGFLAAMRTELEALQTA
ncbi:hypothetical protein Cci01nite_18760 [Catellatospora citrea]|uniref:Uncharacterized protein n=1 Tax=Catellatospora citrea TaxID=53366 RepID=A0A8J3K5F1_9ACTN|nr:hypothetical protein Cci01nite_18760 [Catellatospora citrea]